MMKFDLRDQSATTVAFEHLCLNIKVQVVVSKLGRILKLTQN